MKNMKPHRIIRQTPLVLISLMLISAILVAGKPLSQSKVVRVGILPFQDETDTNAPPELGKRLAAQLKQRLSMNFKDVLPKSLSSTANAALSTEQVVALGKQSGVQFVVRGGVLSLSVDEQSNVTAQIYAEIVSVDSGNVNVLRHEGRASGSASSGGIQWGAIDLNGASFSASAIGKALDTAIESLLSPLHQAVSAPVAANASSEETISESVNAPAAAESANAPAATESANAPAAAESASADADEELQQLIAQAEEVVSSGSGDEAQLNSVSQALQKLKNALSAKASKIEGGADPATADQQLAAARSELQAALTTLSSEAQTSTGETAEEGEATSSEKKGLMTKINEFAGEAVGILQKIQEMRAAFRGATEEAASENEQLEAAEQPTEDVSGVVMEEGNPVAGVEVTDKDSEVQAVTGPDGSYTLKGLPAGKLATLVVKKDGKQLAAGQVDVLRGRPGVADFDVKAKMAPGATALRVIPSTVILKKRNGPTGTIKGTARDKSGKALPRALVTVPGVAVARTDSLGRYSFVGVPVGAHQLKISRSGMRPETTRVSVKPNSATQAQSQLTASVGPRIRDRAIVRGSGTNLHGRVLGSDKQPLAGAKVMLLQSTSAVSVLTTKSGQYELKDLRPGTYTAVVSKLGYENSKRRVTAAVGKTESQEFQLKQKDSAYVPRVVNDRTSRSASSRPAARKVDEIVEGSGKNRDDLTPKRVSTNGNPARTKTAENTPARTKTGESTPSRTKTTEDTRRTAQVQLGQIRGRVIDVASRAPISGAIVAIPGRSSVVTGRDGSFTIGSLPPGSHELIVRKPGFADRRGVFRIRGGATTPASIELISTARKPVR